MKLSKLLKYPIHPPLVHFPLAFLMTSALSDVIFLWKDSQIWLKISSGLIKAGLLFFVPAAIAGFVEYLRLSSGDPAEKIAKRHMLIVCASLSIFLIRCLIPYYSSGSGIILLFLSLSGASLMAFAGWLGGELVFKYRVGSHY